MNSNVVTTNIGIELAHKLMKFADEHGCSLEDAALRLISEAKLLNTDEVHTPTEESDVAGNVTAEIPA